jgi:hypothetical protein
MIVVHSNADVAMEGPEYFVYYGREGDIIPEDVTHVRVHSSVRAFKDRAFFRGVVGHWCL